MKIYEIKDNNSFFELGLPRNLFIFLDYVESLSKIFGKNSTFHIAGGSLTSAMDGRRIKDLDIYCNDPQSLVDIVKEKKLKILRKTDRFTDFICKDIKSKIQIITSIKPTSLKECLETFDFTIVKAGFSFEKGKIFMLHHDRFFQDLASKQLVYESGREKHFIFSSMERLLKYTKRGYGCCPLVLKDMIEICISAVAEGYNLDELMLRYPNGDNRFKGMD